VREDASGNNINLSSLSCHERHFYTLDAHQNILWMGLCPW